MLERQHVSFSQIVDVDVIAHAGAVGRGIIVAEKFEGTTLPGDRLQRAGNQVSFRLVHFADVSSFVGTGGVEVAQADRAQSVSTAVGFEGIFKKQFRNAVRIDRLPGRVFRDRHFRRYAVDRAGGRENKLLHAGVDGCIQQREPSLDVVAEILARVNDALAYLRVRGKVHYRRNSLQRAGQARLIENIGFDQLKAFGKKAMPARKVVVDQNLE